MNEELEKKKERLLGEPALEREVSPTILAQQSVAKGKVISLEVYKEKYTPSYNPKEYSANVAVNGNILRMVKSAMFYLNIDCPISAYINNIIKQHFIENRDFFEREVSKQVPSNFIIEE